MKCLNTKIVCKLILAIKSPDEGPPGQNVNLYYANKNLAVHISEDLHDHVENEQEPIVLVMMHE